MLRIVLASMATTQPFNGLWGIVEQVTGKEEEIRKGTKIKYLHTWCLDS